jgi:hypothetical protein
MCANLRVILVTNTVKVMNEKGPDYERTRNEKWRQTRNVGTFCARYRTKPNKKRDNKVKKTKTKKSKKQK